MELVAATTTWNSVDLVDPFLARLEQLGASRVFVMDFGSDDGTCERLAAPRWSQLVRTVAFPGQFGVDSSNLMLELVRREHPHAWCLFCDPDEFPPLTAAGWREAAEAERWDEHAAIVLPRRNMTAPRSQARHVDAGNFLDVLTLRVEGTHKRTRRETLDWALSSPWIFSRLPGKVLVRVSACGRVGSGDHSADVADGSSRLSERASLLHYPIRSYGQFAEKIRLAAIDLASGMYPDPANSWHWRRWADLLATGRLGEEFDAQFVPDDEVPLLLETGVLVADARCARER